MTKDGRNANTSALYRLLSSKLSRKENLTEAVIFNIYLKEMLCLCKSEILSITPQKREDHFVSPSISVLKNWISDWVKD